MTTDIEFKDAVIPTLTAGEYQITLRHELTGNGLPTTLPAAPTQQVLVDAPRFALAPTFIHGEFPPPESNGDFQHDLPHLTLQRAPLPWERRLDGGVTPEHTPWLALLVIGEGEGTEASTTLDALPFKENDATHGPRITVPDALAKQACRTLTLSKELAAAILPTPDDLCLLTHVRTGDAGSQETGGSADDELGTGAHAVVVANRFPLHGKRNTVHLVSLDGHSEIMRKRGRGEDLPGPIRLLSLWSWSFRSANTAAENVAGSTFGELLNALSATGRTAGTDLLRLPPNDFRGSRDRVPAIVGELERRIGLGYVPLEYRLPTGESMLTWYRGPLVPTAATAPSGGAAWATWTREGAAGADWPRSAAAALAYDKRYGVFDSSYAVAWSLGRALALADSDFLALADRVSATARKHVLAGSAAGGRGLAQRMKQRLAQPMDTVAWTEVLGTDLTTLQAWWLKTTMLISAPSPYLIPLADMLESEKLRFFHVDPYWLRALRRGALSVCVQDQFDDRIWNSLARYVDTQIAPASPKAGVVIRSALVSGWPAVVVKATLAGQKVDDRRRRLAGDALMVLFSQVPDKVEIGEPHHGWHFGVNGQNKIRPRVAAAVVQPEPVEVSWRNPARRVLNMTETAAALGRALRQTTPLTSAQLAPQMVQSAKTCYFTVAAAATSTSSS